MRRTAILIFLMATIGCVSPLGTIDSTSMAEINKNMNNFQGKQANLIGRYSYTKTGINDKLTDDSTGYSVSLLNADCRKQSTEKLAGFDGQTVKVSGVVTCDAERNVCEVSCNSEFSSAI